MPKSSGSDMKTVRLAPRPAPKARPIMHQTPPSGPKVSAMSPGAPKIAADLKQSDEKSGGSIDPRQMVY
jgi:hypothetical protein